jgi:predicted methyltransferase
MRLLVLSDDPSAGTNLHEPLEEISGGEELEVKVVAPLRPESTLDLVTGDIDEAKAAAEERAARTAEESERADLVTRAGADVGDADQLLALADALAEFEADQIVLVDPDDEGLAAAARERFGLPVTELSAG